MTIVDTMADAHYGDRVAHGDGLCRRAERGGARTGGARRRRDPVRRAGLQRLPRRGRRLGHRGAAPRRRGPRAARPRCTSATATASRPISTGSTASAREWRQYEAIFPALAASRIDQVSLECANSHVPIELLGAARRQGRAGRRDRRRERPGRDAGARSPRRSRRRCASSRRSGCFPAPIAAWRRSTALWPAQARGARRRRRSRPRPPASQTGLAGDIRRTYLV